MISPSIQVSTCPRRSPTSTRKCRASRDSPCSCPVSQTSTRHTVCRFSVTLNPHSRAIAVLDSSCLRHPRPHRHRLQYPPRASRCSSRCAPVGWRMRRRSTVQPPSILRSRSRVKQDPSICAPSRRVYRELRRAINIPSTDFSWGKIDTST